MRDEGDPTGAHGHAWESGLPRGGTCLRGRSLAQEPSDVDGAYLGAWLGSGVEPSSG